MWSVVSSKEFVKVISGTVGRYSIADMTVVFEDLILKDEMTQVPPKSPGVKGG